MDKLNPKIKDFIMLEYSLTCEKCTKTERFRCVKRKEAEKYFSQGWYVNKGRIVCSNCYEV